MEWPVNILVGPVYDRPSRSESGLFNGIVVMRWSCDAEKALFERHGRS